MRPIDADALVGKLNERKRVATSEPFRVAYGVAADDVLNAPTIRLENDASWVGSADGYADGELIYDTWECSNCGKIIETEDAETLPKFCPGCGSRMEVPCETD